LKLDLNRGSRAVGRRLCWRIEATLKRAMRIRRPVVPVRSLKLHGLRSRTSQQCCLHGL